jgi:trans-2,3-dihydro-3-hydroxyanthranilate isomerase
VFVLEPDDAAAADARVRIFTPATELPFAGHPVLGTAFVLGEERGGSVIRLQTGVGVIPVALVRADDGTISFGEMEQMIPSREPFEHERDLLAALGVAESGLPVEAYRNGPLHVYVELPSEAAVAELTPDLVALERLGTFGVSCFAATAQRVKTRMFGPALGVPEDPATGSAAGPLAVHLVRHGRVRPGTEIEIEQGAEIGRPSQIRVRVDGSGERIDRVLVGGAAVIVARGEYRLQ